ncbi:hypothetical protein I5M32_08635 [Pedobacter sp. SD-b]|uniref:Outer membrane protein beta-barrel domain-containing protein n=1 Tax=Pedobacter segetis TaxID=2793069 RepID=A0ABS1BJG7_9SPHI|nr:hypothetical protein [Pedobacter segetis]MBK0383024.1 hypothetical protein [Pedobacter segetis]
MKFITSFFLSVCFLIPNSKAFNKNPIADSCKNQVTIIAEYQRLRSTHSTVFQGFNLIFTKQINLKNSLGLGLEYSNAPFHGDNGYNLYDLKFLPVFVDFRHNFLTYKILTPFFITDLGYTFIGYDREKEGFPLTKTRIKEGGIYLNGAIGLKCKILKRFYPNVSFGFKGFHNSFNNLDIDPHGLVFRTGIAIVI